MYLSVWDSLPSSAVVYTTSVRVFINTQSSGWVYDTVQPDYRTPATFITSEGLISPPPSLLVQFLTLPESYLGNGFVVTIYETDSSPPVEGALSSACYLRLSGNAYPTQFLLPEFESVLAVPEFNNTYFPNTNFMELTVVLTAIDSANVSVWNVALRQTTTSGATLPQPSPSPTPSVESVWRKRFIISAAVGGGVSFVLLLVVVVLVISKRSAPAYEMIR